MNNYKEKKKGEKNLEIIFQATKLSHTHYVVVVDLIKFISMLLQTIHFEAYLYYSKIRFCINILKRKKCPRSELRTHATSYFSCGTAVPQGEPPVKGISNGMQIYNIDTVLKH